ncbi:MAG: hypothetical protein WC358_00095 [Ignavibacteria bacterium]|jgi:NTP pyrophosphatase (non-canonical NTP hydrolase)
MSKTKIIIPGKDGEEKEYTINEAIKYEIERGTELYGNKNLPDEWLTILAEESGEVAKDVNELRLHPHAAVTIKPKLKYELIQVIAVSLRFINNL